MVEQEELSSCEHPPENGEFPLKKKKYLKKWWKYCSVYIYAYLGVKANVKQVKSEGY